MSEFKREERYIVVKLKDIPRENAEASLRAYLKALSVPTRECVVVEPHHPHYEETWENVQRWAEGRPTIGEERDALAAHVESANAIFQRGGAFEVARDGGTAWAVDPAEVAEWQSAPPTTTSLARLKAEWQAEALEGIEAVGKLGRVKPEQLASFAGSAAEELRRQAEGEP